MIAAAAQFRLARGERSPWSLNAEAALAFPGLASRPARKPEPPTRSTAANAQHSSQNAQHSS